MPALDRSHRVEEHLAVLFADDGRDLLLMLLDELAEAVQDPRAPERRRRAPCGKRRDGRLDGRDRRPPASANGTALMTSPVAGLVTTPCRLLCDAACCPLIHSGTRATATGVGTETVLVVDIEVDSPVTTVHIRPMKPWTSWAVVDLYCLLDLLRCAASPRPREGRPPRPAWTPRSRNSGTPGRRLMPPAP